MKCLLSGRTARDCLCIEKEKVRCSTCSINSGIGIHLPYSPCSTWLNSGIGIHLPYGLILEKKRILHMGYFLPKNPDYVKTAGGVFPIAIAQAVIGRCLTDTALLWPIHCFQGMPALCTVPVLDFGKYQICTLSCYQVDFPETAVKIPMQNPVSFLFQKFSCLPLIIRALLTVPVSYSCQLGSPFRYNFPASVPYRLQNAGFPAHPSHIACRILDFLRIRSISPVGFWISFAPVPYRLQDAGFPCYFNFSRIRSISSTKTRISATTSYSSGGIISPISSLERVFANLSSR